MNISATHKTFTPNPQLLKKRQAKERQQSKKKLPNTKQNHRGLRLDINLGSNLLINTGDMDISCTSVVVGQEPWSYIIIRTPRGTEIEQVLKKARNLIVQYHSQDNSYEFQSSVLGSIADPFWLTFLSYPDTVEIAEIRKHLRTTCYLPVTANLEKYIVRGVISDISTAGCKFNIRVPGGLQPKQIQLINELKLSFPTNIKKVNHDLNGNIRNTRVDNEKISFGVEFQHLNKEMMKRLKNYIESISLENS